MTEKYDLSQGGGRRANVEFVSAYPSRGLRVEDAYAAFTGDVLANLLADAGWEVTREYYVNDSGPQADALARSVYARLTAPKDFAASDSDALAESLRARIDPGLLDSPETTWLPALRRAAIEVGMDAIKSDLAALGVRFDVFTPDSAVDADQSLPEHLKAFAAAGLLFDEEGDALKQAPETPRARLFLDTPAHGDTRRRPLTGAEGRYTYFAYDLAYHANKMARGFELLVDVFRKDYGSYGQGLAAGVDILSGGDVALVTCPIEPIIAPRPEDAAPRSPAHGAPPALAEVLGYYGAASLRRLCLSHPAGAPLELSCDSEMRRALDAGEARQRAALDLPSAPVAEALLEGYAAARQACLEQRTPQPLMTYADGLANALCSAGAASDLAKARLTQCRSLLGL